MAVLSTVAAAQSGVLAVQGDAFVTPWLVWVGACLTFVLGGVRLLDKTDTAVSAEASEQPGDRRVRAA